MKNTLQVDLAIAPTQKNTGIELTYNGKLLQNCSNDELLDAIRTRNNVYLSIFPHWYKAANLDERNKRLKEFLQAAIEAKYPDAVKTTLYYLYNSKFHGHEVTEVGKKNFSTKWLDFGMKLEEDQRTAFRNMLNLALENNDHESAGYLVKFGVTTDKTPENPNEEPKKTFIELRNKIKQISEQKTLERDYKDRKEGWGKVWEFISHKNAFILIGSLVGALLTVFSGAILLEASQVLLFHFFIGFAAVLGVSVVVGGTALIAKLISDKYFDHKIGETPVAPNEGKGLLKEVAALEHSICGEDGLVPKFDQLILTDNLKKTVIIPKKIEIQEDKSIPKSNVSPEVSNPEAKLARGVDAQNSNHL